MEECKYDPKFGQTIHVGDCPIAKLIRDKTGSEGAIVGHFETYLINGSTATRCLTPPDLREAIKSFEQTGDLSAVVGEFTFLPIPEGWNDPTAKD
jgi:hypothetical protein